MKRFLIPAVFAAIAVGVAAGCGCGTGSSGASGSNANATVKSEQIAGSGSVLVSAKGNALYTNSQEKGMLLCNGACLSIWKPLTLKGTLKSGSLGAKLGVVSRGGTKQVTYQGKPLYTFYLDKPGQVGGNGFNDAFGSQHFSWHVVHPNGTSSSSNSGQTSNRSYNPY